VTFDSEDVIKKDEKGAEPADLIGLPPEPVGR
jgi:hypothetical protein